MTTGTNLAVTDKTRVLVVEDDTMIIDMVAQKLSGAGFDVQPVIDGALAVSTALSYNPHVIILDLMLPNLGGEEILKELASKTDFNNTRIIVFTNKSREENEATVKALGADEYLIKASTDLTVLVKHIKELTIHLVDNN